MLIIPHLKKLAAICLLLAADGFVSNALAEALTAECRCEETKNGVTALSEQKASWEIDVDAGTVNGNPAEIDDERITWTVKGVEVGECTGGRQYLLNRLPTGYSLRKPCRKGECGTHKVISAPALFSASKCLREDCSKHKFHGLTSIEVYSCHTIDGATQQHCQCEVKARTS